MQGRGIHRRLRFEVTPNLVKRFNEKFTPGQADDCWEWQAALREGYGAIGNCGHVLSAHVVSYVIHRGEIPEGHVVRHTCDNRPCVNPGHLISGTPIQNVQDAMAAGTHAPARGERIHTARITEDDVRRIWALRQLRGMGARRISRQLSLPERCVNGVLYYGNWAHVAKPNHEESMRIASEVTDTGDAVRLRGEDLPHSVLTVDVVRQIKALRACRKFGARRISNLLGLKERVVDGVIHRGNWSHVPTPTHDEAVAIVTSIT